MVGTELAPGIFAMDLHAALSALRAGTDVNTPALRATFVEKILEIEKSATHKDELMIAEQVGVGHSTYVSQLYAAV